MADHNDQEQHKQQTLIHSRTLYIGDRYNAWGMPAQDTQSPANADPLFVSGRAGLAGE